MIKRMILGAIAAAVLGAAGAFVVIEIGLYNVAASEQHTRPVFWLLQEALSASIRFHSRGLEAPDLDADAVERGRAAYRRHCSQCHGAPGIPPADFALGMKPIPSNLVNVARDATPEEVFWTVKHGIKMTGMPAWGYQLDDDEIWDVTAFVMTLPSVTPFEYRRYTLAVEPDPLLTEARDVDAPTLPFTLGDPERGAHAISHYGCTACHVIPGIVGRDVRVGPMLAGIGERKYIAGVLVNRPENMLRWLLDPHEIDPLSAMPDLGIKEKHASDIAAYLYGLDEVEAEPLGNDQ